MTEKAGSAVTHCYPKSTVLAVDLWSFKKNTAWRLRPNYDVVLPKGPCSQTADPFVTNLGKCAICRKNVSDILRVFFGSGNLPVKPVGARSSTAKNPKDMKTLKTTLSAIAFATITAGVAFAGPSNPGSSFTGTVPVRQSVGCPMIKAETKLTNVGNSKVNGPTQQTTGYKHQGCTGSSVASLKCKPTGASCASMRQS